MKNLIKNILKTLLFFDLIVIIKHYFINIESGNLPLQTLWNELASASLVALFTAGFIILIEKKKIDIPFKKKPLKAIVSGGAIGLALPIFIIATLVTFGVVELFGFNEASDLYLYIPALLLSALYNELLLRGYLFSLYKKHYKFLGAVAITTALFLCLNTGLFNSNPLLLINATLLNIILCFVYDFTGSFLTIVAARFFYTLISTLFFGSLVIENQYTTIVASSIAPNSIEDSWILTITLSLMLIFFLCHKYKLHKKIKRNAPILLKRIKEFNMQEIIINLRFKFVMLKKKLRKSKVK